MCIYNKVFLKKKLTIVTLKVSVIALHKKRMIYGDVNSFFNNSLIDHFQ